MPLAPGRRLALTLLLIVASAGPAHAAPLDTLTVVTLNLWNDQQDWPRRLRVIVPELRRLRPDVVCLQEVLQNPNLRNQAETLGDSLGCHVQFATVDGPERPKPLSIPPKRDLTKPNGHPDEGGRTDPTVRRPG